MSSRTLFASLLELGPNDPPSTNGNAFFSENPGIIDQFLRIGAVGHRHDAHPPIPDPTTVLNAEVTAGAGLLDGDTTYYLGWTIVDNDGGETMISPTTTLSTGVGIGTPPTALTTAVVTSAGIMPAGDYYYAKTWTDGAGGETPLSEATEVYIDPGYASASVALSGLLDSAPDTVASTRLWRSYQGSDWHLLAEVTGDTYVDSGFNPPDNPAQPPVADDTAGSTYGITLAVPYAPSLSSAYVAVAGFNVYLSTDPSFPDPSLATFYPVASAGSATVLTSDATQQGEPPANSRASRGAALINPDTDMVDFPWKRSVSSSADLPADGNNDGDVRVVTAEARLYAYVASATAWAPLQSTGGTGGGVALTVAGVDGVTTISLDGATVTDDGDGTVTLNIPTLGVTDGSTSVNAVTTLTFTGATITDLGSGNVHVTISDAGGGGGSTPYVLAPVQDLSNLPVDLDQLFLAQFAQDNTGQTLESYTYGFAGGMQADGTETFALASGVGLVLDTEYGGVAVSGVGTGDYSATPGPVTADVGIVFKVDPEVTTSTDGFGVWARWDPTTNSGYMAFVDCEGTISLLRYDNGVSTQLYRASESTGFNNALLFRVTGDVLTLSDTTAGGILMTATDGTYTSSGAVGIRGVRSSAGVAGVLAEFGPARDLGTAPPDGSMATVIDQEAVYIYKAAVDAWAIAVPPSLTLYGYDSSGNFAEADGILELDFDQDSLVLTADGGGVAHLAVRAPAVMRAHLAAAQTLDATGWVQANLDTLDFDTSTGEWGPTANAFTVQRAGTYQVNAIVTAADSGAVGSIAVYVNGAETLVGDTQLSDVWTLAQGDVVTLWANVATTSSLPATTGAPTALSLVQAA